MDIKTLESFRLSDAVKFHDNLNPKLWSNNKLRPEVKKQLKIIAEDFLEELGVSGLDVVDITVSGSNAAYSYTPHSDLDLHIIVDMSQLSNDEVYKELFQAKKTLYNDSHSIKVHGVPVELYVQDSKDPVISLGEYSLLNDKWLKFPAKRRANFDQTATKSKYNKLLDLIKFALNSKNLKKVNLILKKIKQYRQAGLDKAGEFGPENIAYKALRSQGYITKLYSLRDQLHSKDLSIETMYAQEDYHPNAKPKGPEFKPTMPAGTVRVDVSDVYDWYKLGQHISNMKGLGKHDFGQGPPSTILSFGDEDTEHKYIQDLEKTGLTTTDIDPVDPNQPKGMKRQKVDPTYNVNEAKTSIRSQIINAVQQNGPGEYFVRFTDSDKLGFSQKQMFGKTPDIGDDVFDVDNIGQNVGRRVLWFYPLNYYLKNYNDVYASEQPYVWLVKLKPNAWLQKVKRGDTKKLPAPNGKERVGILRMSDPPAALFFSHGYDIVGKYYDYAKQHKTHGQVQGKPKSSFFDRVRGVDESADEPKQGGKKSAIYSTDVYGSTAYHVKCLEPNCGYESKRYDSIKLAQNAAQKHAEKHFKQGVAEYKEKKHEVNEVFDTKPGKKNNAYWEHEGVFGSVLHFETSNGLKYRLDISPLWRARWVNPRNFADMTDEQYEAGRYVEFSLLDSDNSGEEKMNVTGTGSSAEVFGIVANGILEYVKKFKPPFLIFQAAELNRRRLYNAMLKRLVPSMTNYELIGPRFKKGTYFVYDSRIIKLKISEEESVARNLKEQGVAEDYSNTTFNVNEASGTNFVYHVTPTKNLKSIAKQGLVPTVGDRASRIAGEKSGIYVFPDKTSAEDAVMNWLGDEFDDEPLTMLKIDVTGLQDHISKGADYELIVGTTIEPKRIKKVNIQLEEASGYIPGEKEKNDPRFKTALTVDVKPDSIKKNAKAFNSKISRAGIPPTLKPSGKF